MKTRTTFDASQIKEVTVNNGGFQAALTLTGEMVGRYQRYSYGNLTEEWTEWVPLQKALVRLTMSRGQVQRRQAERTVKMVAQVATYTEDYIIRKLSKVITSGGDVEKNINFWIDMLNRAEAAA